MKNILLLITLLALSGCGGSTKQYILSTDSLIIGHKAHTRMQIGVDKIAVPGYLDENKIAVEKNPEEISYLDDVWAVPTSKALTDTLIHTLQKKFSNPNIYLYPWGTEKESGRRIKVTINKFIYSGTNVVLETSYFIEHIGGSGKHSYLYSTAVASKNDTTSIVHAMDLAFARLINQISNKIN